MEKIQIHLMKDGDLDKTSSVEETPAISEPIPLQAGPSGETEEPTVFSGTSFQADLEARIQQIKAIQLAKIPEGTESIPIGPTVTLTEPVISRVRAPPPEEPIYHKRTVTPIVPLETTAESSAKPAITVPTPTVGGGDSGRPFTLKNLEALGKFSGIKHPIATTWLTKMSHWIHLSKVPEADLWDLVATRMSRGVLTWINARMSVAEKLGVRPWVSWQAFEKALKAQFEPLSKEERARKQIWKLVQSGNVNTYIYCFRELKNEIPLVNLAEVYH